MNILIVNQSIIDMVASFITLLTGAAEVDGTRMSRDSVWDQFVCRMWLSRIPLWTLLSTSTYNILLTVIERYVAVIYHIWYSNRVRTVIICTYRAAFFNFIQGGLQKLAQKWHSFCTH